MKYLVFGIIIVVAIGYFLASQLTATTSISSKLYDHDQKQELQSQ